MVKTFKNAWQRILEPKHKKALMSMVYAFAMCSGMAVFVSPPVSISSVLGAVVTHAWALLFIFGGLAGLATVVQGWWWGERLALYGIIIGAIIYASLILYLHHTALMGNRLPQFFAVVLSIPLLVYRWSDIKDLPYEPRRRE